MHDPDLSRRIPPTVRISSLFLYYHHHGRFDSAGYLRLFVLRNYFISATSDEHSKGDKAASASGT
jgi:hypothetical protein